MRKLALFLALTAFSFPCPAQTTNSTPPPATQPIVSTFSFTASPIALPGGKSTVAAAVTGEGINVTNNLTFGESNLVAPNGFQYYAGFFKYSIPALSTKLNNISQTLNGLNFLFYVTGSAGVDRITVGSSTTQHYGFTGGGGVEYKIAGSNTWSLGAEVQYAKFPGLANNTAIVSVGPTINF